MGVAVFLLRRGPTVKALDFDCGGRDFESQNGFLFVLCFRKLKNKAERWQILKPRFYCLEISKKWLVKPVPG